MFGNYFFYKKNKYGNHKTTYAGMTFDSRKEAARYAELEMLERAGHISALRRQVRFQIIPKLDDERAAYYVADFVYTEDGRQVIEDVKSPITRKNKEYVIKRKLVKWQYKDYIFREY